MNKRQKEIIGNRLVNDEQILKELKQTYEEARKSIDDKINQLLARDDSETLQSIIYQVDYQKALKEQINVILDDLNTKQFDSISKYLTDSYEDGFIGTMYDIQGQGIPLVFPFDQKSVIRTLKHDSKLSTSLYNKLGQDVGELKNRVRSEIARGISQSYSYDQIARNIANQTKIGYNKAVRIARTESHRITNEAALDAQYKAKEAGADVVKQWDATLDGNTRDAHRILDGQIRELDEPFEIGSYKAMYPGGFGTASLDINCRCSILQRAKWALDEDELKVQKERAKYFDLDKTRSYEEYKEKYLKAVDRFSFRDYLKGYSKTDLQNLAFTQGMRDFGSVSKMSESELKEVVTSWFEEMGNEIQIFKNANSNLINKSDSAKDIIQKLQKINYTDLPETVNQHSLFQRYALITRDSDLPSLVKNLDDVDGAFTLFRGVKDNRGFKANTINEMTKHSNYSFYGNGVLGDGIYFSTKKSGAIKYGDDVLYAKLKKNAKTIDFTELEEKTVGITEADKSIWAAIHGYDAIVRKMSDDETYISVLNRRALWIKE